MRHLTNAELEAIARLRQLPMDAREVQQSQVKWSGAIGTPLPIIHQVLSEVS